MYSTHIGIVLTEAADGGKQGWQIGTTGLYCLLVD
jgi:hypothetical protein